MLGNFNSIDKATQFINDQYPKTVSRSESMSDIPELTDHTFFKNFKATMGNSKLINVFYRPKSDPLTVEILAIYYSNLIDAEKKRSSNKKQKKA